MSLALEQPKVAPVQVWGCSRARDIFETPGPSPQKTTCFFSYRFRGSSGISALYQGLRVPTVGSICDRANPTQDPKSLIFKKVLLRWHVCRANFARNVFLSCEFSYEKCSKISPKFLRLYLVGPKILQNSHQISPPNLPVKNQKSKIKNQKSKIKNQKSKNKK